MLQQRGTPSSVLACTLLGLLSLLGCRSLGGASLGGNASGQWLTVLVDRSEAVGRGTADEVEFEVVFQDKRYIERREVFVARESTDRRGRARVWVPRDVMDLATYRAGGSLVGRVVGHGLQERTDTWRWNRDAPEEQRPMELEAQPGITLRVWALSPDRDCVDAQVGVWTSPSQFEAADYSFASAGEPATLHIPEGIDRLWILASALGHGGGLLEGIECPRGPGPHEYFVDVRSDGVVRGIVLDRDGAPSVGLRIRVSPTPDSGERGVSDRSASSLFERAARADGVDEGTCTTDLRGRFEIRGLRSGRYEISATGTRARGPIELIGRTRVDADGRELEFRVDRSTLVVHLECPEGVEMPKDVRVAPLGNSGFYDMIGTGWWMWPETWTLGLVQRTTMAQDPWGWGSWHFVRGTHLGENIWVFDVEPGAVYDFGVVGPGLRWEPTEVRVPESGGRVQQAMLVQEPVREGWLELDLVDPLGQAYRGDALIRILDPSSAVVITERRVDWSTDWPWSLRLPIGEHRIVIDPRPDIMGLGASTIDEPASCSRFDRVVSIAPGQTTELRAPLSVGARIQLTTEGQLSAEWIASLELQAWEDPAVQLEWTRSEHGVIRCWLESPRMWPIPLEFSSTGLGYRPGCVGAEYLRQIRLGHRAISELLPAGSYDLVGFSPTGETVRIPVELIDGMTTEATLRFED